ncbi:MAG: phosphotransferase enzyme family protein [Ktedonobacterales bacterium]
MDRLYHIRPRKHAEGEKGYQVKLDLAALHQAWPLPEPWRLQPMTRGTNNAVLLLETPAARYVLRIYGNHADLERLHFEHAVLMHLRGARLPFAVPVLLPTAAGELYARVTTRNGERLATLTAHIPGEHPRTGDLEQARAGGEALGMLDVALANLASLPAEAGVTWRSHGDLAHGHPLVPDLPTAFEGLPLAEDARKRLVDGYERVMAQMPLLHALLPRQIVHEDCDMSNMLLAGSRVTGVLDFEFCGRDVRAIDLTVALIWWALAYSDAGGEWSIMRALTMGYARHVILTADEIAALPVLMHYRAYTSLVHRLGRYRQGLSSLESVLDRANAALERADWLHANGQRLVENVRRAFQGKPGV